MGLTHGDNFLIELFLFSCPTYLWSGNIFINSYLFQTSGQNIQSFIVAFLSNFCATFKESIYSYFSPKNFKVKAKQDSFLDATSLLHLFKFLLVAYA